MNTQYLTLDQAAEYLGVSQDTIRRYVDKGELPAYKLDRASRFRIEDLDGLVTKSFEALLVPGLRVAISHSVSTGEGVGAWRVILRFYDTTGPKRLTNPFGLERQHTEYYVWVSEEYLEDFAKLPANIYGAEKFALQYIKNRFEETKNEYGERDITRITENSAVAATGKLIRGNSLSLQEVLNLKK